MEITVTCGKSFVLRDGKQKIICDRQIQKLVGNVTYKLLYFNNPSLYKKFYDCTLSSWKTTMRSGLGTMAVVNMQTIFLDTDYTCYDLKKDLIRIILEESPSNQSAKDLVGSSIHDPALNMSGWDSMILIFIFIIISICISWYFLVSCRNDECYFDICNKNYICPK